MNIHFMLSLMFAWFMSGLLGVMILIISDMRGEKFRQDYFMKNTFCPWSLIVIAFVAVGPIALIGITASIIAMKLNYRFRKPHVATNVRGLSFVCLCYQLANIGIKKV